MPGRSSSGDSSLLPRPSRRREHRRGEHGEVEAGFLDEDEPLWRRREQEVAASAKVLGVQRVEFLGYVDSGMIGTPENEAPESFWQADLDEAAERLAAILRDERANVLTIYDEHGNYGHPDHIKVHQVGVRAADIAGITRVYESTVDRDAIRDMIRAAQAAQAAGADDVQELPDIDGVDEFTMGSPSHMITTRVDVRDFLDKKRASMQSHASQISETSFFLAMPPEQFAQAWGTEWYIRRDVPEGTAEDDLFAGL